MHISNASNSLSASSHSSMLGSASAVHSKVLNRNFMPTPYRNMSDLRTTLRASQRARTHADTAQVKFLR